jgi:hypothetical protein
MPIPTPRRLARLAAAVLLLGAVGCDRSPTCGGHPDPAAVQLTVGAQVATVSSTGVQTGTLTLAQGTHTVAVAWLDASLQPIADLGSNVSLRIVPAAGSAAFDFTPTGLRSGTLTVNSAGPRVARVQLMHGTHADFSQNLGFTVQ